MNKEKNGANRPKDWAHFALDPRIQQGLLAL